MTEHWEKRIFLSFMLPQYSLSYIFNIITQRFLIIRNNGIMNNGSKIFMKGRYGQRQNVTRM